MKCPQCNAQNTIRLRELTTLGYRRFQCKNCRTRFNERSGSPFNFLEYPTDLVLLIVRWRIRYKLSLRDLSEMMLDRGVELTHESVRTWETRFAPLIRDFLRFRRRGCGGESWYVDETYIKVKGKWCYLYRAITRDGTLIDCRLSETQGIAASIFSNDIKRSSASLEASGSDLLSLC